MARFTEEQERQIVDRYRAGEAMRKMGVQMHTSDEQIKIVLAKHGVSLRPSKLTPQHIPKEIRDVVAERYKTGEGYQAIARDLHIGGDRVKAVLQLEGIRIRSVNDKKFDARREEAIASRYATGESSLGLSREFGCTVHTVLEIARRSGLTINPRGNRYRQFSAEEIAEMARRWEEGESQHTIALSMGIVQPVVSRVLAEHGYQKETRLKRGERHGHWKGGRIRTGDGYIAVAVPFDHRLASMRNRTGYIPEHRLVMAEHLGRTLHRSEHVHHIDGDRSNNVIGNLQLRSKPHGNGVVYCCADCGSHNIVARTVGED